MGQSRNPLTPLEKAAKYDSLVMALESQRRRHAASIAALRVELAASRAELAAVRAELVQAKIETDVCRRVLVDAMAGKNSEAIEPRNETT